MEKCFKNTEGEYITSISTGHGMEEITQEEYDHILSVIRSRPAAEPGYMFMLKSDLTWEMVESPAEPDDDISNEEALDIILGGEYA